MLDNFKLMETPILENIKLFISNEFGRDVKDIHHNTMIERDLGIYGDDAYELIVGLSEKFNVDVSRFLIDKYFSSEATVFPFLIRFLKIKRNELTIKNLMDAVKYKKLDEEIINISNESLDN